MIAGFQCWLDEWGDVWVADGIVMQPKEDVLIHVGTGSGTSPMAATHLSMRMVPPAVGSTHVGGSGRNLVSTGLTPSYSGAAVPCGFFRPAEVDTYRLGEFVLVVTGPSEATISDGTDTVAILSSGGTAPIGSYASTPYGAETYNAETAFSLTVAAESATPADAPKAVSSVSAGSGPAGEWTPTGAASYALDADGDFTLAIAADGSAEILFETTVIAERASGMSWHPGGIYTATAAGLTFNGGAAWTASVRLIPAAPVAGTAYLEIVETSGVVSSVNGPFYGTLPTASGSSYFIALAEFDGGGGSEQYHAGAIILS